MNAAAVQLREQLLAADPASDGYAVRAIEQLLQAAIAVGASDVHLQPTRSGMEVRWRVDGVLQPVVELPAASRTTVVARLKVLADLLTYQTETPQEGRIRLASTPVEMRVSTFPTLFGEKAVVRFFSPGGENFSRVADLGLPSDLATKLLRKLAETSGAILICGPAGSGKTTTAYASLREIVAQSGAGRSVASLEDPIESVVSGVAQSQINARAEFDFSHGLRSLMRQDPEVIFVGEIRDRTTAETAFQAALTGQLLLTTFHAGSAASALGRLADMGIPPYVLRSGILVALAQRLVRRLCSCAVAGDGDALGLDVASFRVPHGCDRCQGTGYQGRLLLVELLEPHENQLARAILAQQDVGTLQSLAEAAGMIPLLRRACEAVAAGQTSPAEVRRVLGFGPN